jgi:Arc/MetJ-type ribon-helix-helix transcriptional regulator
MPRGLPGAYPGEATPSPPNRRLPAQLPPEAPVRETKVTVKIPRPLYRKVQQVVDGSGFNSPTDFIVYVLRDLMGEAEGHSSDLSQDELDDVKRKLKNLGYL